MGAEFYNIFCRQPHNYMHPTDNNGQNHINSNQFRRSKSAVGIVNRVKRFLKRYREMNSDIPTGSDESTIIASYFPLGAVRRNLIAVKIIKINKRMSTDLNQFNKILNQERKTKCKVNHAIINMKMDTRILKSNS